MEIDVFAIVWIIIIIVIILYFIFRKQHTHNTGGEKDLPKIKKKDFLRHLKHRKNTGYLNDIDKNRKE